MSDGVRHRADAAAGRHVPLTGGGRIRFALRVAWLIGAVLLFVPLHYIWRLFRLHSPWPQRFLGAAARAAGARVEIIGHPLRRDVFYVANHLSWIDILAIGGASGSAFVAKAEIGDAPVVGWLAGLNRTVYVRREDKLGVADQIAQLRDALADNWAITVFPEGTTTDGRSMLPFKSSMMKVLEPPPPGVRVQPVLMDYGPVGEDIAWIGAESGRDNAVRVLARRGSFGLRVHFLEPFDPRDFPGRKAIAAESRRRIADALAIANRQPLRAFIGHDTLAAG